MARGDIPLPKFRRTQQVVGVAAANNYLSITNPVGSGVVLLLQGVRLRCSATTAVSGQPAMFLYRASAVSGGTTVTNSTGVAKFRTSQADSKMVLRTGNPTATLGAPLLSVQSIESVGAGSSSATEFPDSVDGFSLEEDESIVLRAATGAVGQRWGVGIMWAEVNV